MKCPICPTRMSKFFQFFLLNPPFETIWTFRAEQIKEICAHKKQYFDTISKFWTFFILKPPSGAYLGFLVKINSKIEINAHKSLYYDTHVNIFEIFDFEPPFFWAHFGFEGKTNWKIEIGALENPYDGLSKIPSR